jgi:hypothetical protein
VTERRPRAKRTSERRRLRPAALLCAAGCVAAPAVIAIVVGGDARQGDPPSRRALPDSALATERWGTSAQRRNAGRHASRRPVNVADRDAPPPERIVIPAIGMAAPIVPLRLAPDGSMETPHDWHDAGWHEPGREPGERGPAVIAGHVDSDDGPAVFYRVRELRRGDVIRIQRADDSVVRFDVEGVERWPKAAFPTHRVFGRTKSSVLRRVTCSGDFDDSTGHYADNTIVYAARALVRR